MGQQQGKKKKKDRDCGDCGDCGGCDLCLFNVLSLRMLAGFVLAMLGLGSTVRAVSHEAGTPQGFLARRLHTAVRYYQLRISPRYPARCRYTPTCSAYAVHALRRHGALRGGLLTVRRLARCRPNGPGGSDPVPGAGVR